MYYDGPIVPIQITDITIDGNAQCEGTLYDTWTSSKGQPIKLGTNTIGITCVPKTKQAAAAANQSVGSTTTNMSTSTKDVRVALVHSEMEKLETASPPADTDDIPAGSVTIITDSGPIYAQIPRRFSPSLESQFQQLQASVASLQASSATDEALLSNYVLATAYIYKGASVVSKGATFNSQTGVLSFPNPTNLKFAPIASVISSNGAYDTFSCFTKTMTSNTVVLWQGALDTSGRNGAPISCAIVVLAVGG